MEDVLRGQGELNMKQDILKNLEDDSRVDSVTACLVQKLNKAFEDLWKENETLKKRVARLEGKRNFDTRLRKNEE